MEASKSKGDEEQNKTTNTKKRSQVCGICNVDTHSYHLNYGANSCLSCRAFFRRTVQSGKEMALVCKAGGACQITEKTRRRCKRCRFDLCIQAGMRPENVLDSGQIKVRFRRMIRKKTKRQKQEDKRKNEVRKVKSEPPQSQVVSTEPESSNKKIEPVDSNRDQQLPTLGVGDVEELLQITASSSSSPLLPLIEASPVPCQPLTQETPLTEANWLDTPDFDRIAMLQTNWLNCLQEFSPSYEFLESLGQMLRRAEASPQHLISFRSHLTYIAQLFERFANMQVEFKSLQATDRQHLLEANTPLFLHYLIARFISSNYFIEQANWILLGHSSANLLIQPSLDIPSVLTLKRLNDYVPFFADEEGMQMHYQFSRMLNQSGLRSEDLHIIAFLCLFRQPTVTLNQSLMVRQALNKAVQIVKCFNLVEPMRLLATLEAMQRHLPLLESLNQIKVEKNEPKEEPFNQESPIAYEIALAYSESEEDVISRQMTVFSEAMTVVPMGEEMVREFITYSFDVPVSKNFIPKAFQLFTERFRFILKTKDEFKHLSDFEQAMIWEQSSFNALALVACKHETQESGLEQCITSLSPKEQEVMKGMMGPIEGKKLKKFSMSDQGSLKLVDEATIKRYVQLAQQISAVVRNDEWFGLLMLIVLFSSPPSEHEVCNDRLAKFFNLGKQYSLLAQRKIKSRNENEICFINSTQLLKLMNEIREMASITKALSYAARRAEANSL